MPTSATIPTHLVARARVKRDRQGVAVLPRIIERKPRPGDVHPLPRPTLAALLLYTPMEYWSGLKYIELRARADHQIGEPFGRYSPHDKVVILYSLPAREWVLPVAASGLAQVAETFGATAAASPEDCSVVWQHADDLAQFFFCFVLLHELGHHHDNEYRHKRKPPQGRRLKEASADLHMKRLRAVGGRALWRYLIEQGEIPRGATECAPA